MTQPDALQIADRLRDGWGLELRREAEAELRRLHAQRDALLEALEVFTERSSSEEFITITVRTAHVERARVAIAKAEGAT